MRLRLSIIAAVLLAGCAPAWAAVYAVAATDSCEAARTTLTNATSGDTVWFPARASGNWTNGQVTAWGNKAAWIVPPGVTLACSNGAVFDALYATRTMFLSTNAVLTNAVVINGYANGIAGGGVKCATGAKLWNCSVSNNYSSSDGGGVYLGWLYNCTISSNRSENQGGGNSRASVLSNCVFRYNVAGDRGGGAYYASNVFGGTFQFNSSAVYGGGLYLAADSTSIGLRVEYNTAVNGGGGIYGDSGTWVDSCVIAWNTNTSAGFSGGGIRTAGARSCTIVSNYTAYAGVPGGGNVGSAESQYLNCIVFGGRGGTNTYQDFGANNIVSNCYTNAVAFIDTNWTPTNTSATINAANDSWLFYATDFRGAQGLTTEGRVVGVASDQGAVERFPDIGGVASSGSRLKIWSILLGRP